MARFQVVLAGVLASAATGLICSAGVLLLGWVGWFLASTESELALDEAGTFVLLVCLVGALGVAVGVLLGVAPTMAVVTVWDRVQRSRGTRGAIWISTAVAAIVALVEVAAVAWWFENVSAREATAWSLACAGLAAVTGFLSLHAAWRSARRRRADVTLGY